MIEPVSKRLHGCDLFVHEEESLSFGYNKGNLDLEALRSLFPSFPILFLEQVHSARIVSPVEWREGIEADGFFLNRGGIVAVIKTADCLPLFFFDDERSRGGILHVGWRGLQQGIEERLAERLRGSLAGFSFFLGPGIERNCYEVGEEVKALFATKSYANAVFAPSSIPGKYFFNLKQGVKLSLKSLGVPDGRIVDCGTCTFCSKEGFPSFRRDGGTQRRILNFLALKSGR